jgi:Carbohydrate-binding module 48 (Isoamylase N-terminal domain).
MIKIMRKLTCLLLVLMISAMAFAQNNLQSRAVVNSPGINQDKAVTFRFVTPKAIRVQAVGDFLAPHRPVDMQEGENGIWEYTTKILTIA